jgi:hypothetical protein
VLRAVGMLTQGGAGQEAGARGRDRSRQRERERLCMHFTGECMARESGGGPPLYDSDRARNVPNVLCDRRGGIMCEKSRESLHIGEIYTPPTRTAHRVRAERSEGGAAPEAGAAERSEAEATAAEEEDAALAAAITTPQRPKRKEGPTAPTYVHTRQYRKRQKSESYMLRNGHSAVLSKRAVEVGPATVERTADGRYDWQDGRLRKRRRESTAGGDGERRLRPRDPGRGDGPPPP